MQKLDPNTKRSVQIWAYCSQPDVEIIHKAAAKERVSASKFVAEAAVAVAKKVLRAEQDNGVQ